jgi:hypothetical protein
MARAGYPKEIYVVFDTELERIVGCFDNEEAAEDCEASAPGDRYTEKMELCKHYNEKEDPRVVEAIGMDEIENPYDDEMVYDLEEDKKDPYGD